MPHNNAKHHPKGEGVKLIGTPVELINLMIPGVNERAVGTDLEKKQIADAISQAPEHEALVYAMCLQAIEWTTNTKDKK